uniref:Putative secreted protein n=1 Tax=Rhipicephalus microplus TaxID=6941 RepID=A0A6G5A4B3_RHIMP
MVAVSRASCIFALFPCLLHAHEAPNELRLCLACSCVFGHACCLLFDEMAAFLKHCMVLLLSCSVVNSRAIVHLYCLFTCCVYQ